MIQTVDAGTLIVIPCCAAKASGGTSTATHDQLAARLPDTTYAQLCHARRAVLTHLDARSS